MLEKSPNNKLLDRIYQETVGAFNKYAVKKPTESDFSIQSAAFHTLKGIDLAEIFMVEPLIDTLTDYLPKDVAKQAFKDACQRIQTKIDLYIEDKENLDVAISHNRAKLKQIGIPKNNWGEYGGEFK